MTKTEQVLEYVKTPRTREEITDHFKGFPSQLIYRLIKKGCVEKKQKVNDKPEKKYSRHILTVYVATGLPMYKYQREASKKLARKKMLEAAAPEMLKALQEIAGLRPIDEAPNEYCLKVENIAVTAILKVKRETP